MPESHQRAFSYYSSLLSRIVALVNQAFNNGVAHFLISMFLVVLAFISGRIALGFYLGHASLIQRQLNELAAESEPRRLDRFSGISSLLLGPINLNVDARYDSLGATSTVYQCAREALNMFTDLAMQISARSPCSADTSIDNWEAQNREIAEHCLNRIPEAYPLCAEGLQLTNQDCRAYATEIIMNTILDRDQGIRERSTARIPAASRVRGHAGVSLTDDPMNSVLLIPSLYADRLDSTSLPQPCPKGQSSLDVRLRQAVKYSQLLDFIVLPLQHWAEKMDHGPNPRPSVAYFFQAYFISPDHVLRFWHQGGRSASMVARFPDTRYWAAANYSERLLAGDAFPYHSRAYFDYGEGGVTLTIAAPVSVLQPTGDSLTVGIAAIDFRLGADEVAQTAAWGNVLFNVYRARVSQEQLGENVHASVIRPNERILRSRWATQADTRWEKNLPWSNAVDNEKSMIMKIIRQATQRPEFGREIVRIQPERAEANTPAFVIPIGDPQGKQIDALVLIPKTIAIPIEVFLFGGITLLGIGIAAALSILGARNLSRDLEVDGRRAVLRGLQVGFARVGSDGRITEANDRAEEILGIHLPKPGTELRRVKPHRPHISSLIHDEVVCVGEAGARKVSFEVDILRERTRAKRSSYYAKLKRYPDVVIKIMATPVLAQADGPMYGETFATFEMVDDIVSLGHVLSEFEGSGQGVAVS